VGVHSELFLAASARERALSGKGNNETAKCAKCASALQTKSAKEAKGAIVFPSLSLSLSK